MLGRSLARIRRRVGGLVSCAALSGLLAPPDASAALSPLYLRVGETLSIAAPSVTTPREVAAFVQAGERAVLAEFLSDPVNEPLFAPGAVASLFLVSGMNGMEDCAVVTAEVVRRTPPSERTVVGQGSVATSILPRRVTVDPIEITFALFGMLALPGERIGVAVAVENRCDDARAPKLLYDALGMASAVYFTDEAPPTTTTTTTTTTVTAPLPPPTTTTTTTTTTLPWPAGCLFQPLSGYEAAFCRIDTLAQVLAEEDAGDVGGAAAHARLRRRLDRARGLLVVAQSGQGVRRHLRRALRQLAAFDRVMRRSGRKRTADPDLIEELGGMVRGVITQVNSLRPPR